ncbi:MAG: hypothetical protein JWR16_195 [Nevskia sp.]|nr:hypothetical protein [Nevskia sp.]
MGSMSASDVASLQRCCTEVLNETLAAWRQRLLIGRLIPPPLLKSQLEVGAVVRKHDSAVLSSHAWSWDEKARYADPASCSLTFHSRCAFSSLRAAAVGCSSLRWA